MLLHNYCDGLLGGWGCNEIPAMTPLKLKSFQTMKTDMGIRPYSIHSGLAIYRFGCENASHHAVLIMPGPHRFENPGESIA